MKLPKESFQKRVTYIYFKKIDNEKKKLCGWFTTKQMKEELRWDKSLVVLELFGSGQ